MLPGFAPSPLKPGTLNYVLIIRVMSFLKRPAISLAAAELECQAGHECKGFTSWGAWGVAHFWPCLLLKRSPNPLKSANSLTIINLFLHKKLPYHLDNTRQPRKSYGGTVEKSRQLRSFG